MLALSPADGLALSMVGILGFSLGMIATLLWIMSKNAGRKPGIEDELTEEEQDPPHKGKRTAGDDQTPLEPWEKDGDWWK